jgi:4-amino-4-deoxy-L-arabinose transferase-like glycosyltransferase
MLMIDSARRERWHWWLLLLFVGVFAFGFRFYYVTHAQVLQPVNLPNVRGDAVDYYSYARNLTQHGVFSKAPEGTTPLVADSYRDPGYPLFLASWMNIFGQWDSWYGAVLLSQSLLGALTVVLALCLSRSWMPTPWLAAAGLLMAVWPHSVAMSSYLLSETLFGFLVALGLFLLRIAIDRHSNRWAAAGGLGFSLAALTNAVLLPCAPLLALYLLVRRQLSPMMCASMVVATFALVAPWTIRNASLPPSDSFSSSSGRALINLVQGSWPSMHSAYQAAMKHDPNGIMIMTVINQEIATIQAHPTVGLARIWRRMASHPDEYIRWYLSKPALLWGWNIRIGQGDVYVYPTRNSPFQTDPVYHIAAAICHAINPWLFVLTIAGCLLALLPRLQAPPSLVVTALTLLFVTAIYSVLQAEPRYSIPFRGLEILLAMFATRLSVRTLRASAWAKALVKTKA